MIYTFYSYKGGVGRSMAVANMAELLCKEGLSVLLIDWDLEAPGLERYFPIVKVKEAIAHEGLMDMLISYKQSLAQPPEPNLARSILAASTTTQGEMTATASQQDETSLSSEASQMNVAPVSVNAKNSLLEVAQEAAPVLPDIHKYIINLHSPSGKGRLSLMSAGRRDGENFALYANTLRTFDWQDFYRNWDGEIFFDWFREKLLDLADVILIDSRTGVTEMGGICTFHLADAVVMFCAPNQQNITGTAEMAANFTSDKVKLLRPERPLNVVIVPSRVEDRAEGDSLNQFKSGFIQEFERFAAKFKSFTQNGGSNQIDGEVFWRLKIPHVPFYAFNELVAVREEGKARSEDMLRSFYSLAQRMAELAPASSRINQVIKQRKQKYDVYLSYDEADAEDVARIVEKLDAEGINAFYAERDLLPGRNWVEELQHAVEQSHVCVFIIGSKGLSHWQKKELEWITERNQKGNILTIPVLLPDALATELPPALASQAWVIFRSGIDDPDALRKLVRGIGSVAFEPKPTGSLVDDSSPYRGLSPYYEEHASLFFGREKFIEKMIESLRVNPLMAVVGKSGSGKTAVVHAGLIPKLYEGAIRGSERWLIASFRPTDKPFKALANALLPFLTFLDDASAIGEGISRMDDPNYPDDDELKSAILKAVNKISTRLLLVIDQFEELFRLCKDKNVRDRFLDQLVFAIGTGNVNVVLMLRSDAYADALKHEPLAENLRSSTLELNPMTREELLSAMIEPASKRNVEFESGLTERILSDLGDEPGNLPLLAQTLSELWGRRQEGKLTLAAYNELGGVQGCFVRHADEVYNDLLPEKQKIARRILMRLAPALKSQSYTPRRRLTLAELGKDQEKVREAVKAMADARIIVTGSEEGNETVELAYSNLLNNWERLKVWLEEDRAFLAWRQRLQSAIDEWTLTKQDSGALLSGASLGEAQRWLAERSDDLSDAERDFIKASAAFKNKLIFQAIGAISGVVILGLIAWIIISWIQSRERAIAHSRQLAAAANAQLTKDPELSVLLAYEAASVRSTDEARAALKKAITESRLRATFDLPAPQAFVSTSNRRLFNTAFSSDGKFILGANANGIVRAWDSASRKIVNEIRDSNGFLDTLFSPDGKQILVFNRSQDESLPSQSTQVRIFESTSSTPKTDFKIDGQPSSYCFSPDGKFILIKSSFMNEVSLWDTSGNQKYKLPAGSEYSINASFSPDGSLIAITYLSGLVQLWETATGKLSTSFRGHTGIVYSATFSDKNRLIATASEDKTVKVWDVSTGRLVQDLKNYPGIVYQVTFTPKDRYLITAYLSRDTFSSNPQYYLRVWETGRWEKAIYDLPQDPNIPRSLAISPDGQFIAMVRANTVALVSLGNGETLFTLRGHNDTVTSATFSADGKSILTASKDMTVRLWDVSTGQNPLPDSIPELLSIACSHVSGNMNDDEWAQYTSDIQPRMTCANLPVRQKIGTQAPPYKPTAPQSPTNQNRVKMPGSEQPLPANSAANRNAGKAAKR